MVTLAVVNFITFRKSTGQTVILVKLTKELQSKGKSDVKQDNAYSKSEIAANKKVCDAELSAKDREIEGLKSQLKFKQEDYSFGNSFS